MGSLDPKHDDSEEMGRGSSGAWDTNESEGLGDLDIHFDTFGDNSSQPMFGDASETMSFGGGFSFDDDE